MSVQAITWALGFSDCTSTEKLVLLVLANYADEQGRCWPGRKRIASEACCSPATVSRVIKAMSAPERELLGLEKRFRKDGSRTTDFLVLLPLSPSLNLRRGKNAPSLNLRLGWAQNGGGILEPSLNRQTPMSDLGLGDETDSPSAGRETEAEKLASQLWALWPQPGRKRSSTKKAAAAAKVTLKAGHKPAQLVRAAQAYLSTRDAQRDDGQYVPGLHTWLRDDRFEAFLQAAAQPVDKGAAMVAAVLDWQRSRRWPRDELGPAPNEPGTAYTPAVMEAAGYVKLDGGQWALQPADA